MRQPELTALYSRACSRHEIVPGSPLARRISKEIRRLCESETLPLPDDIKSLLPPCEWVWSHRVPESGYSIVYGFTGDRLTLRTLRAQ